MSYRNANVVAISHRELGSQSVKKLLTQTDSHDSFSGIQSTLSSGEPLYTKVYDTIVDTTNNINKKKSWDDVKRNARTSKAEERRKPISLQQQRAAEMQMHAPTYSHAISKCYCTQENNTRAKADCRYNDQLNCKRQCIPTRVKERRYRAASVPRNLRAVRWADACDYIETRSQKEKDVSTPPSCNLLEDSVSQTDVCKVHNLEQMCPFQTDLEINLLDKVKTFRDSHWSDCHATRVEDQVDQDFTSGKHYVLNQRLFLGPLIRHEGGQDKSPICPLSSNKLCPPGSYSLTSTPPYEANHIIVTLPKLIQETETLPTSHSSRPHKGHSVSHHAHCPRRRVFLFPSDSLALCYQKRDLLKLIK